MYAETKLNEESVYRMNVFVIMFVCFLLIIVIVMNKLFVTLKFEPYINVCCFIFIFFLFLWNHFYLFLPEHSHPVAQITYSKLGQHGQINEFFGLFTRAWRV